MNIPLYVTASVVAVGAIAAIALPIILARVSKRAAPPVNVATPVGLGVTTNPGATQLFCTFPPQRR